ncbi:recombinase family protein [Lysinibacillus sp. NPDC097287]|uniref:recombinase family protein n=1 Tax=Lysinibacillus sp. NPDC097287 TaxID=3364144 RepID=UPI0037F1F1A5
MMTIKNKKYVVFFRRVSSKGQDLSMQESADYPFRQQFLPKEIKIIEEHGVSANKLRISERPKMQELIQMIRNNEVDAIYAFDRSRLFRDFYEAKEFISICRENNVRIFYTSTDNGQPATNNPLVEGVLNIAGDIEGKNIARRTKESRRRFPPKKLGYIKSKEARQYIKDPTRATILYQFFTDFMEIKSFGELDDLLQKYKSALKTSSETLLKILSDPFYAGYELSSGKNKLVHIDPYLTISQFEKLQEKGSLLSKYQEKKANLKKKDTFQPCCGYCKKPMNFRFNIIEDNAWYTCSNKHPKVALSVDDLSAISIHILEYIINGLDTNKLIKDSKQYFQSIKVTFDDELKIIKKKRSKVAEKIILNNDDLYNWKEHPLYLPFVKLEQELNELQSTITETEKLLIDNKKIVTDLTDYLNSGKISNPSFLYSRLIKSLYVYVNEVDMEISLIDYLKYLPTTVIYEEGTFYG